MAKKSSGKHYTSKGSHKVVSQKTKNLVRKSKPAGQRLVDQVMSWSKGRRTMITVENPNPNETNKRFIKLEGNVVFGPWKKAPKND